MLIDNKDGTVTDTETNLMWQQETMEATNWYNAIDQCSHLHLANYADWGLPTIKELFSLVDFTKVNPCIDTNFFPGTKHYNYWSSTDCNGHAWLVHFFNGLVSYYDKSNAYYVRAVRTVK